MVATRFLKRRQQVPKPRDRAPKFINRLPWEEWGQHRRNRQIGEGASVRPGSKTEAKAQDGSPGNLGDPAHVHVEVNRQSGRRVNNDPGPESSLWPSGSADCCEPRTDEGSVDPGSEANKRLGVRDGKS